MGAYERPAAARWGDGVCVSQSRTFFTSSSLVVCGCSRARFCARPRAAQKVAPSLAHLSGAPKQPLDGGDGGCGAHKGALGAYHPTTSHRGWSAPSVRSAAVGLNKLNTPAYSQLLAARCRYWVMQALTSRKISPTLFGERALCRLRPAASAHRRQAARARLRAAALLGPPHERPGSAKRCLSSGGSSRGGVEPQ